MLRKYLGLASPVKRKKSVEDRKEQQKQYDGIKRKRCFQPQWNKEFKWVLFDGTKVYCQICRSVYGPLARDKNIKSTSVPNRFTKYADGQFVTGSTNLKHDTLRDHTVSLGHKDAEKYLEAKKASPGSSEAEKIVQNMNSATINKLKHLFANAHAVAKHSRPLTDYVWLCTLDHRKELNIGKTYQNDKSCQEMMKSIAAVECQKIEKLLCEAKFCTVMSDGSVDVSVIENEIVYIHFAVKGAAYCFFVSMISCDKADSMGIYNAIMKALKSLESFDLSLDDIQHKLVAFAGDGASVNTGKLNGVIAMLRRNISSEITMVHCMAHRLELAFKEAFKTAKLFTQLDSLLNELFKFYHHSAKQLSNLRAAFAAVNIDVAIPTRVGGTRWVSHIKIALTNMFKGYKAFVAHLDQVSIEHSTSAVQAKAKGLLKQLKNQDLIVFSHFVFDVINVLSKLSLGLQKREVCIYQCHEQMEACINTIKMYKTRPGPLLREALKSSTFKEQKLVGSLSGHNSQMPRVVDKLVAALEGRFSDLKESILMATRIADLQTWPTSYEDDFGDDHVASLVDHYKDTLSRNEVDFQAVESEWTMLKTSLYRNHKIHSLTWAAINELYSQQCSNILCVIDLILSLPASTAECERGFSQMKIVKNQYRNKLKSSTMTMLLTIQMHTADVDTYDPLPAIHHWNSAPKVWRRPTFMDKSLESAIKTTAAAEQDITEEEPAQQQDLQETGMTHKDSDYDSNMSDLDEAFISDCSADELDVDE